MATVTMTAVPQFEVDDDLVQRWVEDRLTDAKNRFVQELRRGAG